MENNLEIPRIKYNRAFLLATNPNQVPRLMNINENINENINQNIQPELQMEIEENNNSNPLLNTGVLVNDGNSFFYFSQNGEKTDIMNGDLNTYLLSIDGNKYYELKKDKMNRVYINYYKKNNKKFYLFIDPPNVILVMSLDQTTEYLSGKNLQLVPNNQFIQSRANARRNVNIQPDELENINNIVIDPISLLDTQFSRINTKQEQKRRLNETQRLLMADANLRERDFITEMQRLDEEERQEHLNSLRNIPNIQNIQNMNKDKKRRMTFGKKNSKLSLKLLLSFEKYLSKF